MLTAMTTINNTKEVCTLQNKNAINSFKFDLKHFWFTDETNQLLEQSPFSKQFSYLTGK
jgi:hypothetical protein